MRTEQFETMIPKSLIMGLYPNAKDDVELTISAANYVPNVNAMQEAFNESKVDSGEPFENTPFTDISIIRTHLEDYDSENYIYLTTFIY